MLKHFSLMRNRSYVIFLVNITFFNLSAYQWNFHIVRVLIIHLSYITWFDFCVFLNFIFILIYFYVIVDISFCHIESSWSFLQYEIQVFKYKICLMLFFSVWAHPISSDTNFYCKWGNHCSCAKPFLGILSQPYL